MKKLILMIALMAGIATFAQDKKIEKRTLSKDSRITEMTKELDLTKEQQEKVKVLFEQQKMDRKESLIAKKANQERFQTEFRSILTAEQAKKLDAKKEKMKEIKPNPIKTNGGKS